MVTIDNDDEYDRWWYNGDDVYNVSKADAYCTIVNCAINIIIIIIKSIQYSSPPPLHHALPAYLTYLPIYIPTYLPTYLTYQPTNQPNHLPKYPCCWSCGTMRWRIALNEALFTHRVATICSSFDRTYNGSTAVFCCCDDSCCDDTPLESRILNVTSNSRFLSSSEMMCQSFQRSFCYVSSVMYMIAVL